MSSERIYLYPLWVRIWHWINALLFIVLIITGISMQYSNPDKILIVRFDIAVQYHNLAGMFLTLNYLIYLIGNLTTANGKYYHMKQKGLFARLLDQSKFYAFGIFQKKKPPFPISKDEKFNPLQKVTYVLAMYIGLPITFITGWGMLFPDMIPPKLFGLSGLFFNALLHSTIGFFLSLFMIIHIYMCTIGTTVWSNFKSMFTGWH